MLMQMFKNKHFNVLMIITLLFAILDVGCSMKTVGKAYIDSYTLKGMVFYNGEQVINGQLINVIKKDTITIVNGCYETEIKWATSERNYWVYISENRAYNQKYIIIKYNDKVLKIKNKWKKYGLKNFKRDQPQERLFDLHF
jgi:hypothetical protein